MDLEPLHPLRVVSLPAFHKLAVLQPRVTPEVAGEHTHVT